MKELKTLNFKKMCMSIGNLPSSYVESLSYYECLMWLCKFLEEQVIPTVNNNSEAVSELQVLFAQLKNYVDTYFDNLDVQEEVNNKLDEMAESGELEELLTRLTEGILTDFPYYEEINYSVERDNDTTCYITNVPMYDSDDNEIILHQEEQEYATQTPILHAQDTYTTLTINSYLYTSYGQGIVICDGEVITSTPYTGPSNLYYLCIKENRELFYYPAQSTTAQELIDLGAIQAFMIFYPLVINGVIFDFEGQGVYENYAVKHPRQAIGQKLNGDLVILTCDGRTNFDEGLTAEECASILISKECVNAFMLDGGGSTSTVIRGSKINKNFDSNQTADRNIKYTLNVRKESDFTNLEKGFSQIGFEKQALLKMLMPYINDLYSMQKTQMLNDVDLNEQIGKNIVAYALGFTPKPYGNYGGLDSSCYFINIAHPQDQYKDKYNFQLIMRRDYKEIFTRRQVNEVWTDWTPVNARNMTGLLATSTYNTITADNTYQDVQFELIDTNNDIITPYDYVTDTDRFKSIKIDDDFSGYVHVNISTSILTETAGSKFIKIMLGTTEQSLQKITIPAGLYNLSIQAMIKIGAGTSHEIKVQIYGSQGDKLNRTQCVIETDR